ncbi:MAG: hypothetical protein KDA25_06425 [Phycisphaerales bacterium]|nr:hypothetical protein [Phycisphaerales bacterium]
MTKQQVVICPYCGHAQSASERCSACRGRFEPLSRRATHNAMGPWFVRDLNRPFQPGLSYEMIVREIDRGRITGTSIVRGPTTRQFWTIARRVPGIAHLCGYCHECDGKVDPSELRCPRCQARFGAYLDRNHLGLPEVDPLPGEVGYDPHARPASPLALTPTTISSFAPNAEIAAAGVTPRPLAAAAPSRAAPRPAPTGDSPQARATIRAMEWRLQRQQRTIRMLSVIMVVALLVAIIALVINLATSKTTPNGAPAIDAAATSLDSPPA